VPNCALVARKLLEVVQDILAYQKKEPEHTFASGPLLEIVSNVILGLEHIDGTEPFKQPRKRANETETEVPDGA